MKIKSILATGKPSLSFEVFPPKQDSAFAPILEAVSRLAKSGPSFISVTYGAAGGANSANTGRVAGFIERDCATTALAHLTCITATRDSIRGEVAALRAAGVENVLALRGDVPAGMEGAGGGDFSHASDLIGFLRGIAPDFSIGAACYPEGHPESPSLDADVERLAEKARAGVDFLTTQMFFDNNVFYRFLARLRSRGVSVPVVAGIMPVTNARQIKRICALSGADLPGRFKTIVDRYGERPEAMLDAGIAYATEQIVDLFANGVQAVHVYTMNRPEVGERIRANLAGILEA